MSGPLASRREDLLPDDIDDPELLLRALARFPRLQCSRKCCLWKHGGNRWNRRNAMPRFEHTSSSLALEASHSTVMKILCSFYPSILQRSAGTWKGNQVMKHLLLFSTLHHHHHSHEISSPSCGGYKRQRARSFESKRRRSCFSQIPVPWQIKIPPTEGRFPQEAGGLFTGYDRSGWSAFRSVYDCFIYIIYMYIMYTHYTYIYTHIDV